MAGGRQDGKGSVVPTLRPASVADAGVEVGSGGKTATASRKQAEGGGAVWW